MEEPRYGLRAGAHLLLLQRVAQGRGVGIGVVDPRQQQLYRGRVAQAQGRRVGARGEVAFPLLSGTRGVCGEITEGAAERLAREKRPSCELRKEAMDVDMKPLGELNGAESMVRFVDDPGDRLAEVAEAGEAHAPTRPDAVVVEPHDLRQGVVAAVVIEARKAAPLSESALHGPDRARHEPHELVSGHDFVPMQGSASTLDGLSSQRHGHSPVA